MKVVFVTRNAAMYSYHESTVHALRDRGHKVTVLFSYENGVPGWNHTILREGTESQLVVGGEGTDQREHLDTQGIELGKTVSREDRWTTVLAAVRETLTYASYIARGDDSRFRSVQQQRLPTRLRGPMASSKLLPKVLSSKLVMWCLQWVGGLIPVYRPILDHLRELDPDITVVSPINWASRPGDFAGEVEYARASQSLGIPAVVPVLSWDNLTARGLYYVTPDMTLAWNDCHVEEATTIHGIPLEKIVVTGSPLFDKWFNAEDLGESRGDFCKRVGLHPERPIVVYLGSSGNIAPDETWLIHKLISAVANHKNPDINTLQFIIRPHPANADHYGNVNWGNATVLWPRKAALPDSKDAVRTFYNTLLHSIGTVGINTTGMIDAVVADKPSATIFVDRYKKSQVEAPHFQHLFGSGALERVHNGEEFTEFVERILQGRDNAQEQRRKFVTTFVRSRGLCRSAGSVAAMAIEMLSAGLTITEIERKLGPRLDSADLIG